MKNTLIAAAVAAVFAAPAAFADTTLYGQGHVSLDMIDADSAAGYTGEDSAFALASNSSRVGIKGSHKISDSLTAVYQWEMGIAVDGESGDLAERNRYVGLSGGFGTVVFGKHDTPVKALGNKVAFDWGTTQIGGARYIRDVRDGASPGYDLRADNVIGYMNNFGPVALFAAYVTDHNQGKDLATVTDATSIISENNNFDAFSATVGLGNGKPYYIGLGYEVHNVNLDAAAPATVSDSESVIRLGASYQIGAVKIAGLYQSSDDAGFTSGASRDVYGIGASVKMGKNTIKGQYYVADDFDDNNAATNDSDTGGNLIMVGVDRKLSKMTTVYAQYAVVSNDDNTSDFAFTGRGHGETASTINGGEVSGLSLGLQVKF